MPSDAEHACANDAAQVAAFIAERVRATAGARWIQGRRRPPLACAADAESVRLFAEERLHKIETAVARAIVAWADGERDVLLMRRVPTPREVLALQARGARCVSLLSDADAYAPHQSPLAFALHDLCHLEKFVDAEHHAGQVGFSLRADRALDAPAWRALEAGFDDAWASDRDHVIADMNGSAVFLLAALKMKLKMAVRRREARARGVPEREYTSIGGPLAPHESAAYADALEAMLDAFDFDEAGRRAARRVSTRRDDLDAALAILQVLEADGEAVLTRLGRRRSSAA